MKRYLLILLLLVPLTVSGENENIVYNYSFVENTSTCIFGKNSRIRKSPEIKKNNVVETLTAGSPVRIMKKMPDVLALNGFSEYWYRISFNRKGKDVTGYVWGGLLSAGYVKKGKDILLLGFSKNGKDGFIGECRLVRNGKIISTLPVKLHYLPSGEDNPFYGYSITMKLRGSMGLTGLENVISIYNDYAACGYPRGNVWVGIASGKLYYLGTDNSVSEAGVYQYEEQMIFPSQDKSLKDEVRLVTESFDFDEKIDNYRLSDRKEKRYLWKNFRLEERKR
ncbi:MAG TPA: hypothetical protein PK358_05840 [Spirochaetota bacterium]|nr:hypothetical protein [Spirochaetota bacterium]HPJ34337.1 hypothetical protein [Spirochaetota bacterium]